jgi:DNA repair protein RadD
MELFDYQQGAVGDVWGAYRAGADAPMLVLPTGGGKTVVFTYMARKAWEKGIKVVILVHRKELLSQCSAALTRWHVPHGLISPSASLSGDRELVQVAMVQTLARRVLLDRSGRYRFGFVVVDECHHATPGSGWGTILEHNAGAKLLGVSATPCRLDGKGLGVQAGGFFDHIVIGPTVQQLIDRGRLARPVVFSHDQVDLSGVRKRGGDYIVSELETAMDRGGLIGDAVGHYRTHLAGAPSIAFTVTVAHSEHVAAAFRAAGWQSAVLTGKTPDRERERMIRDLGAGSLNVLCSCNVVSEGTDIPTVMGAILLRPTASFALAMQQMGRPLRVIPGKDRAIILDHAGNCWRHGLPTDPVEWSLDAGAKRGTSAPVNKCFGCGVILPAAAQKCPECGHALRKPPTAGSASAADNEDVEFPEAKAGNLTELTPEKRKDVLRQRRRENAAAQSEADLMRLGVQRGYHSPAKWAQLEWERQQEDRNRLAALYGRAS